MPRVSVLMPAYNAEKYIGDAIKSILNQTFTDFELIIINDGSTDNTKQIIKQFDDERIKYFENDENRGVIFTLNRGLKEIESEFIIRMDADDISLPNRFAEQIKFMDNNPQIGLSGTAIEIFNEDTSRINYFPSNPEELKTELIFNNLICHPSIIIRSRIFKEHPILFEKKYLHAEDYAMWIILSKWVKFSNLNKVLLKYRDSESNITKIADKQITERKQVFAEITNLIYNFLKINQSQSEYKNIHFIISDNKRIENHIFTNNDYKILKKYLKIIRRNNLKVQFYNNKFLQLTIGKIWLKIILYANGSYFQKVDIELLIMATKYLFYRQFRKL